MSSALSLAQENALAAAVDELGANYEAARLAMYTSLWFEGGGFESAKGSLDGSKLALELLRGQLLEAARGFRPWPLDEPGAKIDPAGALAAWQQLAASVRAAIDGVKGYTAKWAALETLGRVGADVAQTITTGSQLLIVAVALVALAILASKVAR